MAKGAYVHGRRISKGLGSFLLEMSKKGLVPAIRDGFVLRVLYKKCSERAAPHTPPTTTTKKEGIGGLDDPSERPVFTALM